jgi:hypothetical protein
MQVSVAIRSSLWLAALCLCAQEQKPPAPAAGATEVKGLSPRGSANDYQAHANAGKATIGAEFMRHSVPTPGGAFSSEDYVAVEVGMFGAAGTRTTISTDDFSLRINGKKAQPSVPFGMVLASLKDPDWVPPDPPKPKSSSLSTGGEGGSNGDPPPLPPKMPLPLVRIMQQKVQKAAIPEGDRPLPEAGLLFFSFRSPSDKIKSVELIYAGPAGKASLTLQP